MKERIFKISCTFCSTCEKTYGFVKAWSEDTAKMLFTQEVGMLHGKLDITQIIEVSEEEYEKAMKGE